MLFAELLIVMTISGALLLLARRNAAAALKPVPVRQKRTAALRRR